MVLLMRFISSHNRSFILATLLNASAISASSDSSASGRRTSKSPSRRSRIAFSSRRRSMSLMFSFAPPMPISRSDPLRTVAAALPLPFWFRFPVRPRPPLPALPFFRRDDPVPEERGVADSSPVSSSSMVSPISTTLLLNLSSYPHWPSASNSPGEIRLGGLFLLFKSGAVAEVELSLRFRRAEESPERDHRARFSLPRELGRTPGSSPGEPSGKFAGSGRR